MADSEGSSTRKVGGQREEKQGFGGFGANYDGVGLSGLTWRARPSTLISVPYLG